MITSIAGSGQAANTGDGGLATSASVCFPNGLAVVASSGNTYISTQCHSIRMITKSTGIITTVAGTGNSGYSGDAGLATTATLNLPASLAIDSLTGNIYVADSGNNAIRKITKSTGIITTVAGTGVEGKSGIGGLATMARLLRPLGVSIDNKLRLIYIADSSNDRILMVPMNTARANISQIAGTGLRSFSGDGGKAKVAGLANPTSVAVDPTSSNVYFTDSFNNRVRMISKSTGIISTVAGTGAAGYSGDMGLAINATLNNPSSLTVDQSTGNIYITLASRVRMININSGRIKNIAGTMVPGYSGDGGQATEAQVSYAKAVAVDSSSGAVLIADTSNSRIRSITGTPYTSYSPTSSSVPSPSPSASSPSVQSPTSINNPTSGRCVPCLFDSANAKKKFA